MIPVKVTKLTKRFGTVEALSALDLTVEPGELFILIGPKGSGKTTLVRTVAGFVKPDKGTIHFGGEDITVQPAHQRNIGMMFESLALWPHLSVTENVAFGLKERRVPRPEIERRVSEALETVRMEGSGKRNPDELFDGDRQRVALARALVTRPRCLLLDEPLAGLDAGPRFEMRAEIRRICKELKLTTIYVTQERREALSVADRMAVLKDGRVLQTGSPREIYRRPFDRTVAQFVGEANLIAGTVASTSGVRTTVETDLGTFVGILTRAGIPPTTGTPVTLSIRPECLHLGGEVVGPQNRLTCTVGEALYLGETARYHLDAGGVRLIAVELNPRQLLSADRGELSVTVDPEDVAVLVD